jgi:hypothetical protein
LKKTLIIFLTLCLPSISFGRNDYEFYYSKIDSAEYYVSIKDDQRALTLYKKVFEDFVGFPNDYLNAISVSLRLHNEAYDPFVKGFKSVRGFRNDLKSELLNEMNQGFINSKEKKRILKLFRKSKTIHKRNKKGTRLILKLIIKDQKARKSGKNIHKIDSLNNLKLKEAIKKNPTFLDHKKYGFIANSMLEILIFHHHYKLWGNDFELLVENIKQGNLSRETVLYLLEREVVWGNNLFKLEKDSLIYLEGKNQKICDSLNLSYSIFGGFKQYNSKLKQHIVVPIHPEYTEELVDKMRKYLLYSSYDLYKKTRTQLCYPNKKDFCEPINN